MQKNMYIFLVLLIFITACNESSEINTYVKLLDPLPPDTSIIDTTSPPDTGDGDSTITDPAGQIFITDQRGKKWNITHAVDNYGFKASRFQFGLGQYRIRPINDPEFLFPGDAGYPSPNNTMPVIGTTLNGESRAYALEDIFSKEIVNDVFGDTHVAVGF